MAFETHVGNKIWRVVKNKLKMQKSPLFWKRTLNEKTNHSKEKNQVV